MSGTPVPVDQAWWLASRAAGITALLCITVAVTLGLALGGRVARRPGWPRALLAVHEHAALTGLVATAVHGIALLGDGWLRPSIGDIVLPFTSTYEPVATGLGVLGGWLAVLLGPTYVLRRRIGVRRWRQLHRATILVYVLAVVHTLGAGTDAQEPWMQALLLATGAPVLFLLVLRLLPRASPRTAGRRREPAPGGGAGRAHASELPG
jgi:sulfoxide reductase heme-binding subunit YedZ